MLKKFWAKLYCNQIQKLSTHRNIKNDTRSSKQKHMSKKNAGCMLKSYFVPQLKNEGFKRDSFQRQMNIYNELHFFCLNFNVWAEQRIWLKIVNVINSSAHDLWTFDIIDFPFSKTDFDFPEKFNILVHFEQHQLASSRF